MKSRNRTWLQEVIISEEIIGKGIDEDPVRRLVVVRDKNGNIIAENDPCEKDSIEPPEFDLVGGIGG